MNLKASPARVAQMVVNLFTIAFQRSQGELGDCGFCRARGGYPAPSGESAGIDDGSKNRL